MIARSTLFLVSLPAVTLLVACGPDSRVPSAPGITADRSAADHFAVPSPRGILQMVHDPRTDWLYLIGGISNIPCEDVACANGLIDDLWRFDARSRRWTQISDQLPPREGDAAALDYRSRQIVMFQPYFSTIPETWAYDLRSGTWVTPHPALEPPPRLGSMMVYDPHADRALLYGGTDLNDLVTALGDLWAYDDESNTWSELHPPVSPPARTWSSLVYVPTTDRTILFGGFNDQTQTLLNDTWAYDAHRNRWTNLHAENPPPPRWFHYMAFDARTNRLVMFGGYSATDGGPLGDTWIYDVAANRWFQVFPEKSPSPRANHVMRGTNRSVVLFGGGVDQTHSTNETWIYSSRSNEWEQVGSEAGGAGANITAAVVATETPKRGRVSRARRHQ